MLEVIALRHGITEWNQHKRIQGQTDIPLSPEGIHILEQYQLPATWYEFDWYSSTLQRTRQTADILNLSVQPHSELCEMHWGDWEGRTLNELEAHYGKDMFAQFEAKGLDLQPPNGESPRMVQQRVSAWVSELASQEHAPETIGIVVHKGVIRAMLAAACHWQMLDKPPVKLDYFAGQRFAWDQQQQSWQLLEANVRLLPEGFAR